MPPAHQERTALSSGEMMMQLGLLLMTSGDGGAYIGHYK